MRPWLAVLGCAMTIGGCQTSAPEPSDPGNHTVVHPGDAAASVVGTPLYLVFKSVACVASVAIAAPVAGVAALSESRLAPEVRRELGDGVSQNCGPPYVLSPYRVVSIAPRPDRSKQLMTAQPTQPLTGIPDVLASSVSSEASGTPDLPTIAQPPEPPSDSRAPMTEEFPEPAAGGPIHLFKR
jgi:hypothetical protein